MHTFIKAFCYSLILLFISFSQESFAGAGHDHGEAQNSSHEQRGPKGGRLISNNEYQLEVTYYTLGEHTEMRAYLYQDDVPLATNNIKLSMRLTRLDKQVETLTFNPEHDYLVSNQAINEPHSFDVKVTASINGTAQRFNFGQHENRTTLSDRAIKAAKITTQIANSGDIVQYDTLFGVIAPTIDNTYSIMSPYQGIVEKVYVEIGDRVTKNQPLIKVQNRQTLRSFTIHSPAQGVVTERLIAKGELALEQKLMSIINLEQVWVELSAFPENIERLAIGQSASVYDLHQHLATQGEVDYLSPVMTGGHIAKARVLINNNEEHWRPGMHVKTDIAVNQHQVAIRVVQSAIQTLDNHPVVFIKVGNTFEARPVQLGQKNKQWAEVIQGLAAGDEYVSGNSYIIKADILKSGASHAH